MGDQWQSSPLNHRRSEAGGRPDGGRDNEVLGMGMQGMVSRSRRTTDTGHPHDGELRFEDQEEETLPEEVTGEEVPSPRNPEVALEQLDRVLEKDAEEGVSEMRWACPAGVGAVKGEQQPHPGPGGGPVCPCRGWGALSVSCAGREGGPSVASEANMAPSRGLGFRIGNLTKALIWGAGQTGFGCQSWEVRSRGPQSERRRNRENLPAQS